MKPRNRSEKAFKQLHKNLRRYSGQDEFKDKRYIKHPIGHRCEMEDD